MDPPEIANKQNTSATRFVIAIFRLLDRMTPHKYQFHSIRATQDK
jgi:hypothetical protein